MEIQVAHAAQRVVFAAKRLMVAYGDLATAARSAIASFASLSTAFRRLPSGVRFALSGPGPLPRRASKGTRRHARRIKSAARARLLR